MTEVVTAARPGSSLDRHELRDRVHSVVRDRLRLVVQTLGDGATVPERIADLSDMWARQLPDADPARLWFSLAVVRAEIPDITQMETALREYRLNGAPRVVRAWTRELVAAARRGEHRRVGVLLDTVTVEAFHTASVDFVTGIQRVVRETVRRWSADHELTAIGWTNEYRALRRLRPGEAHQLFGASAPADRPPEAEEVLIPWRGCHLIPELPVEPARTQRLQSLARYANTEVAIIGHDLIPITSPDTVSAGMNSNFARYLPVIRHADRVAVTSVASGAEFRGWRRMVNAAGYPGPEITEVGLPAIARESSSADLAEATRELGLAGLPLILVVGSHEPRKNHLAVLHAAELLWRSGHRFNLVLVGGGSWMSDRFFARVAELHAAGRAIATISGLDDNLLWAGYRLARCVLFPSLNEGFGLPVAEALAAGTPVVTSDFGSMREIVSPGGRVRGGLLVDPRDDRSVATAMAVMLADGPRYRQLKSEAQAYEAGSWDDYAVRTWTYLTGNRP